MTAIESGAAKMKPRWHFLMAAVAGITGLVGSLIFSTFLASLIAFSLRSHGPMGSVRLNMLLLSFPWWAFVMAAAGIAITLSLLKRYDFSYKRNFFLVVVGVILSILIAGWLTDATGLDALWMHKGPMRGLYRQTQNPGPGHGWRLQHGQSNLPQ